MEDALLCHPRTGLPMLAIEYAGRYPRAAICRATRRLGQEAASLHDLLMRRLKHMNRLRHLTTTSSDFHPNLAQARDNHPAKACLPYAPERPAAIRKLFFQDASRSAAAQVMARLVKRGYLRRYRFYRNHVYFTLGPTSVRRFGVSPRRIRPLGEQSLPIDYATLAYCCLSQDQVHKRLLPAEIKRAYPWFPGAHLSAHPYYFHYQSDGPRLLSSIRVELSGSPQYILRKHAQDIHRYRQHPSFRQLIEAEEFMLLVITTSPERADALGATSPRHTLASAYKNGGDS